MNKTPVVQQAKPASVLPPTQGILQRKCACGNDTMAGGECTACTKNKSGLQRKLSVGASNDPLEREADRVADQVMEMPTNSRIGTSPPRIQRATRQSTEGVDTAPASVDRVLASSGRPLDAGIQRDMGQRFGHDFSQVRVHTDTTAEQSTRDVNAHAYTVGNNVVFGAGQFAPETHDGRRLISHELAHVVQQSGNPRPQVQRWAYGVGRHPAGGGATFSEVTAAERADRNGFDAGMAIVDRVVGNPRCGEWFDNNCPDVPTPTLADLNNRAVIWMWRTADASGGNRGGTEVANSQNHAVTEEMFNLHSRWAIAATIIHEYWHDCEPGVPVDIGEGAVAACGLPL